MQPKRTSTILVLGVVTLMLYLLWSDRPAEHSQGMAALPTPRESIPPIEVARAGDGASQPGVVVPIKVEEPLRGGRPALQTIPVTEPVPERGALRREKLDAVAKPVPAVTPGVQALQAIPPQPVENLQAAPRTALQEVPAQPLPPVSRAPYGPVQQHGDGAPSAPQR